MLSRWEGTRDSYSEKQGREGFGADSKVYSRFVHQSANYFCSPEVEAGITILRKKFGLFYFLKAGVKGSSSVTPWLLRNAGGRGDKAFSRYFS